MWDCIGSSSSAVVVEEAVCNKETTKSSSAVTLHVRECLKELKLSSFEKKKISIFWCGNVLIHEPKMSGHVVETTSELSDFMKGDL
ncbi:hypothetical protein M0804_007196 [Polistes exclamans]|nr:hypothetical protein M0804_007196 [Polistes exclamans]